MKIEEKHICAAVLALVVGMLLLVSFANTKRQTAEPPAEEKSSETVSDDVSDGMISKPALSEISTEEPDEYTGPRPAWVTSYRKLNVRQSPDLESEILGYFVYLQKIQVDGTEENGFYLAVGTDSATGEEITGYCSGEYLSFHDMGDPRIQLDVPAYYQTDERWASKKVGSTNKTLGAIGCTTTCMAMSKSYLTQTEVLPDEMSEMLWYDENGDMAWPSTYTWTQDQTYYLQVIFGHLHQGVPVLVGAERRNGRPHWVLVTGYTGDATEFKAEDFVINDPLSAERTNLQQFFDEWPVFYKIAYYSGEQDEENSKAEEETKQAADLESDIDETTEDRIYTETETDTETK